MGIWGMLDASCFQASSVGVEGAGAVLGVRPSTDAAEVTGGAGGDEGAWGGLASVVGGKVPSVFPFAAPPSVRKWKLQVEEGVL